MTESSEHFDQALPAAAARRLSNQIARAYRGTYGAQTGLRSLVKIVARQMLRAGSSSDTVSRVLEHYVLNQPASVVAGPRHVVTGTLNSSTLVELTRECIAEVALEAPVR